MARQIHRSTTSAEQYDRTTVTQWFKDFVLTQETIKKLTKRAGDLKKEITAAVEVLGEEDEKGHLILPIDGVEGYAAAQRQRKVSQSLNEEELRRVLTAKGGDDLLQTVYKLVPVLDEDEVYALFAAGTITEQELDAIFPKSVNYAFVPVKG